MGYAVALLVSIPEGLSFEVSSKACTPRLRLTAARGLTANPTYEKSNVSEVLSVNQETTYSKLGLIIINKITASGFLLATAADTKTFVSIITLILPDDKLQFLLRFPLRLWDYLRVVLVSL